MSSTTRSAPIARPLRWDPFRELEELQRRTEELVETAVSGVEVERLWAPLVDIEETEGAWIVEAEVPGAQRNDVLTVKVPKAKKSQARQIEVKSDGRG